MYVHVYVYVIKIYIMVKEYKQFMYIIYNYEFIVWSGQPKTLIVVQAQYESYTLSLKPKPQSLTLFVSRGSTCQCPDHKAQLTNS